MGLFDKLSDALHKLSGETYWERESRLLSRDWKNKTNQSNSPLSKQWANNPQCPPFGWSAETPPLVPRLSNPSPTIATPTPTSAQESPPAQPEPVLPLPSPELPPPPPLVMEAAPVAVEPPQPEPEPEPELPQPAPELPPISPRFTLGTALDNTPVALADHDRRLGLYIIGETGVGKSTLLLHMVLQDIANHQGLCVIDPHGDLINDILMRVDIPADRIVLLDPTNWQKPFGLNLFECSNRSNPLERTKAS